MYVFNAKIKVVNKENIIYHLRRMIEALERGEKAYITGNQRSEEGYYGYYKETNGTK